MWLFLLSPPWRWPHEWSKYVGDQYAIKLHPQYRRAFADLSVHFMHLETYRSNSQTLNRRSEKWADDESNEFWMMLKHGIESYFGIDAQKRVGASTAHIKHSCLPRTNQKCQLLKYYVRMLWRMIKFCCPWKQIFNKLTFSARRHVQTSENLLIPLNMPVFSLDLLLLIPGVMRKTLWKLAMFAFRILRILSGHHIDQV